jgi:hypothetical protein
MSGTTKQRASREPARNRTKDATSVRTDRWYGALVPGIIGFAVTSFLIVAPFAPERPNEVATQGQIFIER